MPDYDLLNEQELLTHIAAGNQQAFRQLFLKYHQHLGAHIYRLTNSEEMAEEVVQDVFLKIWLNRESLGDIQHFGAYLFVMSKNQALNYIKKMACQQKRHQLWEQEHLEGELTTQPATPDYYSLLDLAIDNLPPQQQTAYLLSRHERLKYTEIAAKMNISRETVKKYLQLANTFIATYVKRNSDMVLFILAFLNFLKNF